MNLDQFAASFRPVERSVPSCDEEKIEAPSEVIIAGTVLKADKSGCVLEINGATYELSGECVFDIQLVSAALRAAREDAAKGDAAERKDAATKKDAADKAAEGQDSPETGMAFVKVKGDAMLTRKVEVPAHMIAATGTWVSLVPVASQ